MNEMTNYALMFSLKDIAFVKIGTTLLNQDHIRELLSKYTFVDQSLTSQYKWYECVGTSKETLKEVEDLVFQSVLKLPLPVSLKNKLKGFIEALCWQLLKWQECIRRFGLARSFKVNITKFYWTSQGTIDKKKSVEFYLKDESLPIYIRYQLACEYCLEDYVFLLGKQIKVWEHKKHISQIPIMSFWFHYVRGTLHDLKGRIGKYCKDYNITPRNISPYEYMFRVSAWEGNEIATIYFFQKLTTEEKEKVLFGANLARMYCVAGDGHNGDVVCFLFSNMNEEQKNELLEDCPYNMLQHFLIWPRQRSFMELVKCLPQTSESSFIPDAMYLELLRKIAIRIISNCKDYNYQQLLAEFWHKGPNTHKKYVIDHYDSDLLLSTVFKLDDKQNIQFILKDKSVSLKRKNPFFVI